MRGWTLCETDGRPYFLGERMESPDERIKVIEAEPVLALIRALIQPSALQWRPFAVERAEALLHEYRSTS